MRTRAKPPVVDANDRLGLTFFLATVFHGILILGVTFSIAPAADTTLPPALDIILVQSHTPSDPDEANYLAQVSQKGGGDSEEKSRPRDIFTAPTLAKDPGMALQTSQLLTASLKSPEEIKMLYQKDSDYSVDTDLIKQDLDEITKEQTHNTNKITKTARLAKELSAIFENQADKSKVKYVNSSTREFIPARYMRKWIDRVERIGNLNYPDQARRKKLNGTLILDVVINSDGTLVKSELRRSSGHKILDDAAQRIVRLAAPYSAFPPELKNEADVIHITRSWEFLNNNELRSK